VIALCNTAVELVDAYWYALQCNRLSAGVFVLTYRRTAEYKTWLFCEITRSHDLSGNDDHDEIDNNHKFDTLLMRVFDACFCGDLLYFNSKVRMISRVIDLTIPLVWAFVWTNGGYPHSQGHVPRSSHAQLGFVL